MYGGAAAGARRGWGSSRPATATTPSASTRRAVVPLPGTQGGLGDDAGAGREPRPASVQVRCRACVAARGAFSHRRLHGRLRRRQRVLRWHAGRGVLLLAAPGDGLHGRRRDDAVRGKREHALSVDAHPPPASTRAAREPDPAAHHEDHLQPLSRLGGFHEARVDRVWVGRRTHPQAPSPTSRPWRTSISARIHHDRRRVRRDTGNGRTFARRRGDGSRRSPVRTLPPREDRGDRGCTGIGVRWRPRRARRSGSG